MERASNYHRRAIVVCTGNICSLGLIRSLGKASIPTECYAYGYNADSVVKSRYVSASKTFQTVDEVIEYLINEYPANVEKPIIYTSGDDSQYCVDMHHAELTKKFILFSAGEQGKVVWWMDKQHIGELARSCGLNVPWMIRLRRGDDIPDNLTYPIFTKSAKTADGGKSDEHICRSKEEFLAVKDKMIAEEFLAMPFIYKVKELNYFGIAKSGRVYINYMCEDLRAPEGSYGYFMRFCPCNGGDLYEKIISLVRETGYEGLFEVEFLEDNNGIKYFSEVNFRVDGSTYACSYGINLPAWWYYLNNCAEDAPPEKLVAKDKIYYAIQGLDDFKCSVMTGKVNVFLWCWQYMSAIKNARLNLLDPRPTYFRLLNFIKSRLC